MKVSHSWTSKRIVNGTKLCDLFDVVIDIDTKTLIRKVELKITHDAQHIGSSSTIFTEELKGSEDIYNWLTERTRNTDNLSKI